ncbi:MAG TPA: hypothetical protein VHP13_02265 [Gammaproteobacteria bacterium]|jgi:hypothetical protein|nr:hypothetical protein [Gammaproteobacteria bacterium]
MLLAAVTAMEMLLAARGYMPTLADSPGLWQRQRARAAALGPHALILVGNSRMQNDVDLATLRWVTGLEPVQLAVGGSSFMPVLAGLAADPAVTGTVVVNFEADALARPPRDDLAQAYQSGYDRHGRRWLPDFAQSEDWLADQLHFRLRSYADGTRPLTALLLRILTGEHSRQFQDMDPQRQVRIDFRRVDDLPRYALVRAVHELGPPFHYRASMSDAQLRMALEQTLAALAPDDGHRFAQGLPSLAAMASAIATRGGRVIFVQLPRGGLVREVDGRRYPRSKFWDVFAGQVGTEAVNYEDVVGFTGFTYPDDSHLDRRDQARFTQALAEALHLDRRPPG